jgi:hypothetical protein
MQLVVASSDSLIQGIPASREGHTARIRDENDMLLEETRQPGQAAQARGQ